jgi:DNA-binding FrmR family transcriptional regulator
MDSEKKRQLTSRLNRIAGQLTAVQRMVEEDQYCVDVLTQIAAVRSALDKAGVELLTNHLRCCVVGHGTSAAHKQTKTMPQKDLISEVETVLNRFLK